MSNTGSALAALVNDKKKLAEAASAAAGSFAAPGQMPLDDANAYMAEIKNLFPGEDAGTIEMNVAIWAALQDVGGTQDFSGKDPIIVGQTSIPATHVFGEIIPVDNRGLPRKFCSTLFEPHMPRLLEAMPWFRSKLTPKAVKAGLMPGDELKVVSFVRGVTPSTVSGGGDRQSAKDTLLTRRPTTQGASMSYNEPVVREMAVTSNHNAKHTSSNALF